MGIFYLDNERYGEHGRFADVDHVSMTQHPVVLSTATADGEPFLPPAPYPFADQCPEGHCDESPSSEEVVQAWKQELRNMSCDECLNILQDSSMATVLCNSMNSSGHNQQLYNIDVNKLNDDIDKIIRRIPVINYDLKKIARTTDAGSYSTLTSMVGQLTARLSKFSQDSRRAVQSEPSIHQHKYPKLFESLRSFTSTLDDQEMSDDVKQGQIDQLIKKIEGQFKSITHVTLSTIIQQLISNLEVNYVTENLRTCLHLLLNLSLHSDQLCDIIVQQNGVEKLLTICRRKYFVCLHSVSLRILATLCVNRTAVVQLYQMDALTFLTTLVSEPHLLRSQHYPSTRSDEDSLRCEAMAVLAQITCPALQHYKHVMSGIEEVTDSLVRGVTDLLTNSETDHVFLIGGAVLANLCTVSQVACSSVCLHSALQPVVERCILSSDANVYEKLQASTILSNMAAGSKQCVDSLVECYGVELLIDLLTCQTDDADDKVKCKVRSTAALAVSRLLNRNIDPLNPDQEKLIIDIVIRLDGIEKLVKLCSTENGNSKGVMVSALVALKSIADKRKSAKNQPEDRGLNCLLRDAVLECSDISESSV